MRRHSTSRQSFTTWRSAWNMPITVMSGTVTGSGSTNVSSGVAMTPAPKPETARTA